MRFCFPCVSHRAGVYMRATAFVCMGWRVSVGALMCREAWPGYSGMGPCLLPWWQKVAFQEMSVRMMGSDYISEGGRAETNIEVSRGMAAERVGEAGSWRPVNQRDHQAYTHTHTHAHAHSAEHFQIHTRVLLAGCKIWSSWKHLFR